MSEKETFGPRLRRERERRGISLETISRLTMVSADLWEGLERNDFSRWPSGLFARSFVRDYARALGLDAEEIVDEFCRLFPVGDRRAGWVIKAQAELIGHDSKYADESGIPPQGDRRSESRRHHERRHFSYRLAPRALSAVIDLVIVLSVGGLIAFSLRSGFWTAAGPIAVLYYSAFTVATGASIGQRAVELLRHRLPALFTVQGSRRAHA